MNALAEILGTAIFVFLYFLFLQRNATEVLSKGFSVQLATSIGLSYFIGVYLPFYTYRIHIFPFVSIIEALKRRDGKRLVQKVFAQFIGSMLAVFCFLFFFYQSDVNTKLADSVYDESHTWVGFLNQMLFVVIVSLFYYYMRFYSKAHHAYGHILMSIVIGVLLFQGASWSMLSASNSFGMLLMSVTGHLAVFKGDLLNVIVIHVAGPIVGIALAWGIIVMLGSNKKKKQINKRSHA